MGIEKASPGKYGTACGKGYFEYTDEPPEIALKYDAIDYFKYESANSFFIWEGNGFKRVWISD